MWLRVFLASVLVNAAAAKCTAAVFHLPAQPSDPHRSIGPGDTVNVLPGGYADRSAGSLLFDTTGVLPVEYNILGGLLKGRVYSPMRINLGSGILTGSSAETRYGIVVTGGEIDVNGSLYFGHHSDIYYPFGEFKMEGGRANAPAESDFIEFARTNIDLRGGDLSDSDLRVYLGLFTMSGGEVRNVFLHGRTFWQLSGGQVLAAPYLSPEATLNIRALSAELDGIPIDVHAGEAVEIVERDQLLSGVLADGTPFSFQLASARDPQANSIYGPYFPTTATVTVAIVPEPKVLEMTATLAISMTGICRRRLTHGSVPRR